MALKLLLASPDEAWLEEGKKFFEENHYEVESVLNGRDAQIKISSSDFFAIVISSELQNHNSTQVLKFIKSNNIQTPVVYIIENPVETEEMGVTPEKLRRLGVDEIVTKPFEITDVKIALEGHQSLGEMFSNIPQREGISPEVQVEMQDSEFTKVGIDEFFSSKAVLFDVFIRLNSGRYVKILHTGDTFTKERLTTYKEEKGVTHLYFHNSERRKFVQFHNFLAGQLVKNKNVDKETKVAVIRNVTEKFVEDAFFVGLKPNVIATGKEICENVYTLIENQKDLWELLREYKEMDPTAYSHAFLTCIFASSIIKQFDWQSKATIETTAMACMFHDIGKMRLPKELLEKRPEQMTEEELELYKKHPEFGAEIVDGNKLVNNAVKQIVRQHHENFDGSGFPDGIKGSQIFTLANVVHLADTFAHTLVEEECSPTEALKMLLGNPDVVKNFNSMIVEKFIQVFVDPDKIKGDRTVMPSNSKVVPSKKVS